MGCSSTRIAYPAISMVEYALLTLITLLSAILAVFLFRKRIKRAFIAGFITEGFAAFDDLAFEEVVMEEQGEKVKRKVLTPYFRGMLGQMAPILVSEGMKAIKLKVPANLPVNAAGELDFMAPVLQKLASGKKVKIEDFLPVIMEKAMPYVEGFLGNLQKGSSPGASESKNPFLKDVGQ